MAETDRAFILPTVYMQFICSAVTSKFWLFPITKWSFFFNVIYLFHLFSTSIPNNLHSTSIYNFITQKNCPFKYFIILVLANFLFRTTHFVQLLRTSSGLHDFLKRWKLCMKNEKNVGYRFKMKYFSSQIYWEFFLEVPRLNLEQLLCFRKWFFRISTLALEVWPLRLYSGVFAGGQERYWSPVQRRLRPRRTSGLQVLPRPVPHVWPRSQQEEDEARKWEEWSAFSFVPVMHSTLCNIL